MRYFCVAFICLVFVLPSFSQSETDFFLLFFKQTYLKGKGIDKINNRSSHAEFSKRYDILIKRIELILKKDRSEEIRSIQQAFIQQLRSPSIEMNFSLLFSNEVLFSTDSFYKADEFRKELEKKYSKATKNLQSIEQTQQLRSKADSAFYRANDFIKRAVEITVPFLFNL